MGTGIKLMTRILLKKYQNLRRKAFAYKPLGAFGPEHEFSIIGEDLKPLPISDKIIKDWSGRITETIYMPKFTFGKENVLHQIEIRGRKPFRLPETFEETMQDGLSTLLEFVKRKHQAQFLGTGMHPTLTTEQTNLWPHGDNPKTMQEFQKIFNLKNQGWLNIQSF